MKDQYEEVVSFNQSMFWEWFWDLFEISFGHIQPCPSCHLWPSKDCGYLERQHDYLNGGYDYDCMAPDNEDGDMECDGCHHLKCDKCKSEKRKGNSE